MRLIEFLFNIGVIFIVLSLIWGFFMMILNLITMGERKGVFEEHILKAANYYLLASLTAIATIGMSKLTGISSVYQIAGLIMLYLYIVGKMEKQKMKMMFPGGVNQLNLSGPQQNKTTNTIYLLSTLALYAVSVMRPEITINGINIWFMGAINDIQETPIIGWIIKFVAVFFLINIIVRGVAQTQKLFASVSNGGKGNDNFKDSDQNNNQDFDDYEIVE